MKPHVPIILICSLTHFGGVGCADVIHSIAIRTNESKPYRYVTNNGGNSDLTAHWEHVTDRNIFKLIDLNGGRLVEGDEVRILAPEGHYWRVQNDERRLPVLLHVNPGTTVDGNGGFTLRKDPRHPEQNAFYLETKLGTVVTADSKEGSPLRAREPKPNYNSRKDSDKLPHAGSNFLIELTEGPQMQMHKGLWPKIDYQGPGGAPFRASLSKTWVKDRHTVQSTADSHWEISEVRSDKQAEDQETWIKYLTHDGRTVCESRVKCNYKNGRIVVTFDHKNSAAAETELKFLDWKGRRWVAVAQDVSADEGTPIFFLKKIE